MLTKGRRQNSDLPAASPWDASQPHVTVCHVTQNSRAERILSGERQARSTKRRVYFLVNECNGDIDPGPALFCISAQEQLRKTPGVVSLPQFVTAARLTGDPARQGDDVDERLAVDRVAGGLVYASPAPARPGPIHALYYAGCPLVLAHRRIEGLAADYAGMDDVSSGYAACEYLIALGHKRIGFAADASDPVPARERRLGYETALRRSGIAACPQVDAIAPIATLAPPIRVQDAVGHAVSAIRQLAEPPTAIVASSDMLAYHLINELSRAGVAVPYSLSVVGFGDIDRFSPRRAFLTTLGTAYETMGERAAHLLLSLLDDRRLHDDSAATYRTVLIKAPLIQRGSCGPPASR